MPTPHNVSHAVRRSLKKLGADIKAARLRRALPASVVAARAFTSRPTLQRIEAGDPGVGVGIYAAVLQALGLLDGLADLADPSRDETGLDLAAGALPRRARLPRATGAA
ncbi:MAG: helix-turn-helix domain-containing protein [Brevundimonas sp.]